MTAMIPQGYPLYLRWMDDGEVVAERAPVIGWVPDPDNNYRVGDALWLPVVIADGRTFILSHGEWEVAR